MTIQKTPFINYTIGEKNPLQDGRIFTIRLNSYEYKQLLEVMAILHISSDSTALKTLAFMGRNVILTLFEPSTLKWLTDGTRRINESKLNKLSAKIEQNVTQNEPVL